jgi:hypothetical protein
MPLIKRRAKEDQRSEEALPHRAHLQVANCAIMLHCIELSPEIPL